MLVGSKESLLFSLKRVKNMSNRYSMRQRKPGDDGHFDLSLNGDQDEDKWHEDPGNLPEGHPQRVAATCVVVALIAVFVAIRLGWIHHDDDGWHMGDHEHGL